MPSPATAPAPERAAPPPRRGLRLRRGRPHRPARAARDAAARGLPVPRRHRALPVRRARGRGAAGLRARTSRESCWTAGRSRSSSRATRPRRRRCPCCSERFGDAGSTSSASSGRSPSTPRWRRTTAASGCSPPRRRCASGAYDRALAAADPLVRLTSVPCPDLAPIIQAGFPFDERVVDTVRGYCAPLKEAGVDTVILGCTHYPLLRPMLQRMLGRDVTLVSPGRADRPPGRVRARRPRASDSPRRARATTASCARATWTTFRALGTRFLQLRSGPSSTSTCTRPRPSCSSSPAEAG